jgi:transposase
MRRDDICLYLNPADRAHLQALLTDRNTPRKVVWRAEIVLATADGCGTNEIMRRADMSKPTVWRWQARYLDEGVAGLRRDKTRPSRVPPLPRETRLKVITRTVQETPPNATHWSRALMAEAVGISPSSVGRIWAEAGGVCQTSCPPISCGVSDLRGADFGFGVEPDGSGGLPVPGFA